MGEEVFIQIIRVTKSFGGITAIREISFDLRRGEILAYGPNGSVLVN
jgi:ABC-type branched-subunit amino acid transport system ATPase component